MAVGLKAMPRRPTIYTVFPGCETPDEPRSGLYWASYDDSDQPICHGPYRNKQEAEEAIDRWSDNDAQRCS
jgi:hypothetical protein